MRTEYLHLLICSNLRVLVTLTYVAERLAVELSLPLLSVLVLTRPRIKPRSPRFQISLVLQCKNYCDNGKLQIHWEALVVNHWYWAKDSDVCVCPFKNMYKNTFYSEKRTFSLSSAHHVLKLIFSPFCQLFIVLSIYVKICSPSNYDYQNFVSIFQFSNNW